MMITKNRREFAQTRRITRKLEVEVVSKHKAINKKIKSNLKTSISFRNGKLTRNKLTTLNKTNSFKKVSCHEQQIKNDLHGRRAFSVNKEKIKSVISEINQAISIFETYLSDNVKKKILKNITRIPLKNTNTSSEETRHVKNNSSKNTLLFQVGDRSSNDNIHNNQKVTINLNFEDPIVDDNQNVNLYSKIKKLELLKHEYFKLINIQNDIRL